MNRVDAWFEQTPLRRLVLWFGVILPLAVAAFVISITDRTVSKAELALVFAPILAGAAIWRGWKAYCEIRG